jgi:ligand-binding SRPBCC domain-containing protein
VPVIRLETRIAAPPQRCFDLARDVDLHQQSAAATHERAVAGVTSGKMGLGDTVTWQATHFGLRLRLSSRITEFDPPHRFVDEMTRGPFQRLRHIHEFQPMAAGTLMIDVFDYSSPLGILGRLADAVVVRRYLESFLRQRNAVLKRVAETPG